MSYTLLEKIKYKLWMLHSLPWSIYINFHYLPFRQAIRLPIIVYKPHFRKLGGSIEIIGGGIRTGMIILGTYQVDLYPNNGIMLDIRGKIIFHGSCSIGNNSFISTSKGSLLEFGNNFSATTTLRLACYDHITFEDDVIVGWDCMFIDTDFHRLTREDGKPVKGFGSINIGRNTWIANGCRIMKNTTLPGYCVVAAYSVLTGRIDIPEKSVIGNKHELKILSSGKWLDRTDDKPLYQRS